LDIADIAHPMVRVPPVRMERATWSGMYPAASIAASTAATVSGLTRRVLLTTWDTVVTDTPAAFATSAMVFTAPS
jgi:hypothetical protein